MRTFEEIPSVRDYILNKYIQKCPVREESPFAKSNLTQGSLKDFIIAVNPKLLKTEAYERKRYSNYKPGDFVKNKKIFQHAKHYMKKYHPHDFNANEELNSAIKGEEDARIKDKGENATEDYESKVRFAVFKAIDETDLKRFFKIYEGMLIAKMFSEQRKTETNESKESIPISPQKSNICNISS